MVFACVLTVAVSFLIAYVYGTDWATWYLVAAALIVIASVEQRLERDDGVWHRAQWPGLSDRTSAVENVKDGATSD